jgi:hypothetical protein
MRTVSDAPVAVVTSVRLLRRHLMRHTGSLRPFRIRVVFLWLFIFRACIIAPRGGPRGEASWPNGYWHTISFLYIRARRFLLLFFLAFSTSHAHFASFARCARIALARRQNSVLRRPSKETPRGLAPPRFLIASLHPLLGAPPQHFLLPLLCSSPSSASSPDSGGCGPPPFSAVPG